MDFSHKTSSWFTYGTSGINKMSSEFYSLALYVWKDCWRYSFNITSGGNFYILHDVVNVILT